MLQDLPDRLLLASASPRRQEMLRRLGLAVEISPADLDDGALAPGVAAPRPWAMSMAWFKAARVAWLMRMGGIAASGGPPASSTVILAADTVCDLDGRIIGKPRDATECTAMLKAFVGSPHRVHTGVCLLETDANGWPRRRLIACDSAVVHVGEIPAADIERYVTSGAWAGKAGGYNFAERLEAGWPLRCDGDAATVMGLPLRRLGAWLERFGARAGAANHGANPSFDQGTDPSPSQGTRHATPQGSVDACASSSQEAAACGETACRCC